MGTTTSDLKLGINGMGRIGKLSLWHHIARKSFSEIVINLGRDVGQGMSDIAQVIEKDSSYGRLSNFLYGFNGPRTVIDNLNEEAGTMTVDGIPVKVLRSDRNPKDIPWGENGVRLVCDTTGAYTDPTVPGDNVKGSLRGHLDAGAEKVVLSAPFKIKNQGLVMPDDAITTVMGINGSDFDPRKHNVLSAASCTTTCLSFMMKPMLDALGADHILSASMVTIHAATGSQKVLDAVPKTGATDTRKNRSIMNNIILTTTGAANALKLVLPEMGDIGFMAESVRVPTATGSLIILTLNIQAEDPSKPVNREEINAIYKAAAEGPMNDYLIYSEHQNVSSDIVGFPKAAATIESSETHSRTAMVRMYPADGGDLMEAPVTKVVIYGWYDNELGSYTNMLGDRLVSIAEQML
ncbi:MAG: glyceraldehyde-3-phosphate dehydrogenase [Gammaproteobacteria bacterium]|nr:glyceraldehyde-3-phosphate dehydrogenase [Gammaproteobacteria bacterium]